MPRTAPRRRSRLVWAAKRLYLGMVPAYNERASIVNVIEALHKRAPTYGVLVIDAGFAVGTAALTRRSGARVLQLPFNLEHR